MLSLPGFSTRQSLHQRWDSSVCLSYYREEEIEISLSIFSDESQHRLILDLGLIINYRLKNPGFNTSSKLTIQSTNVFMCVYHFDAQAPIP